MIRVYSIFFKVLLRIAPSYIYSPAINRLKNTLAKKVLRGVDGGVNWGENVRISLDVSFGQGSGVGDNAVINGPVDFGNNIMMGPNVTIYRSNHGSERTDIPMIMQKMTTAQKLTIEDDVWIGDGVMILPSCKRIGKGVILGARAVVVKDVPDYAVLVGNPGMIVKFRKGQE